MLVEQTNEIDRRRGYVYYAEMPFVLFSEKTGNGEFDYMCINNNNNKILLF